MNNNSVEKLSKVVSAKVTLEDYNLCKEIAAKLYENGEIGRNSVSELVRVLVESLLSDCRKKQENLQRNRDKNNYINTQSNLENKMQFPMEQQHFPMPCSLISTQEYYYKQMYERRENNQQLYDIISKMPETPTLPPNTKTKP